MQYIQCPVSGIVPRQNDTRWPTKGALRIAVMPLYGTNRHHAVHLVFHRSRPSTSRLITRPSLLVGFHVSMFDVLPLTLSECISINQATWFCPCTYTLVYPVPDSIGAGLEEPTLLVSTTSKHSHVSRMSYSSLAKAPTKMVETKM